MPYFNSLAKGLRDKVIKQDDWKLGQKWNDIAVNAGFDETYFKTQYKQLCGFSHTSLLSVMQIAQLEDEKAQKEMADSLLGTCIVVLAKYVQGQCVKCNGVLWILDQLVERACVTHPEACKKLKAFVESNLMFHSDDLVEGMNKRLADWTSHVL